jgi:hypothetical protein
MKPMQALMKVIAQKKPRRVFTAQVGNRNLQAIEQEFILAPAENTRRGHNKAQLNGTNNRLLSSGRLHFISVKSASERYHIAARTIQQLCHDGRLVCQRQGTNENSPWLVAEESIQMYCSSLRA